MLVSAPLNRAEMPLTVFCFAFLGEFDSMAIGVHSVHVVAPSLSWGDSSPQIRLQLTALDTKMDTMRIYVV
jgi:hypothetical protein